MEIEKVKAALRICAKDKVPCWDSECPYRESDECQRELASDALTVIESLEHGSGENGN